MNLTTPEPLTTAKSRLRYLDILQIFSCLAVIAFHTGVPGTLSGRATIELFFVIAGFNMARNVKRFKSVASFTLFRVRRMAPEMGVIWGITFILFLLGLRTKGVVLFLVTAPMYCQNFIEPYFKANPQIDWLFLLALWFVAALLQMQVILFMARKLFSKYRPLTIVCATIAAGTLFRFGVASLGGGVARNISLSTADTIYRMPLTHLEAAVFGFMVGLGLLPRIGRFFPIFAAITGAAGFLNFMWAHGAVLRSTLGFPTVMELNYQYLWGYPLLALTMVSFFAPGGSIARTVEKLNVIPEVDRLISKLASLTYGSYVFHCVLLAGAEWVAWSYGVRYRGWALFIPVSVAAFLSAAGFQHLKKWAPQAVLSGRKAIGMQSPQAIQGD